MTECNNPRLKVSIFIGLDQILFKPIQHSVSCCFISFLKELQINRNKVYKANIVTIKQILSLVIINHIILLIKESEVMLLFMISSCGGKRPSSNKFFESFKVPVSLGSILFIEIISIVSEEEKVIEIPRFICVNGIKVVPGIVSSLGLIKVTEK